MYRIEEIGPVRWMDFIKMAVHQIATREEYILFAEFKLISRIMGHLSLKTVDKESHRPRDRKQNQRIATDGSMSGSVL